MNIQLPLNKEVPFLTVMADNSTRTELLDQISEGPSNPVHTVAQPDAFTQGAKHGSRKLDDDWHGSN